MLQLQSIARVSRSQVKTLTCGYAMHIDSLKPKHESERMKRFHDQLKLEKIPRIAPSMRFVDLVLVDTDPKDGELIPNSDKNPTRWGDWQHNGRVTDF